MIIPKNKTSYISVKQRYFEENKGGEGLTKEGYTVNRIKRHLFYILMLVSLGSVCVLQFFGPTEHNNSKTEEALLYQGEFVWEKTDGSREMIEVPGKYEVPAKTTMTIITQLPENYTESMLAIRSSLQSVRFYVDGELRAEYDMKKELSERIQQVVMYFVQHLQRMRVKKFVSNYRRIQINIPV